MEPSFEYCADVVVSAEYNSQLCKALASAATEELSFQKWANTQKTVFEIIPLPAWIVDRQTYLRVCTEMIKCSRPSTVNVDLNEIWTKDQRKVLKNFVSVVRQFDLTLIFRISSSFRSFVPIDDIVQLFKNSK